MKNYEIMYIISNKIRAEEAEAVRAKVSEIIKACGGEIKEETEWGNRELAYKIKKEKSGTYILIKAQIEPGRINEIKNQLKTILEILRVSILQR